MNAITTISCAALTMSSREIAALSGREHSNVMRDIRTLLDDLRASNLEAGRFVVRAGHAQNSGHAYTQAKFTPKGVQWIAGLWGQYKAQLAQEGGAA